MKKQEGPFGVRICGLGELSEDIFHEIEMIFAMIVLRLRAFPNHFCTFYPIYIHEFLHLHNISLLMVLLDRLILNNLTVI